MSCCISNVGVTPPAPSFYSSNKLGERHRGRDKGKDKDVGKEKEKRENERVREKERESEREREREKENKRETKINNDQYNKISTIIRGKRNRLLTAKSKISIVVRDCAINTCNEYQRIIL